MAHECVEIGEMIWEMACADSGTAVLAEPGVGASRRQLDGTMSTPGGYFRSPHFAAGSKLTGSMTGRDGMEIRHQLQVDGNQIS